MSVKGKTVWVRIFQGAHSTFCFSPFPIGVDLEGYVWIRGKVYSAAQQQDDVGGVEKFEIDMFVTEDSAMSVETVPLFHLRCTHTFACTLSM
jgi:hypothetical protein